VKEDRAVFYANRCAAQLLLENYRSALEDAQCALELEPKLELRLKVARCVVLFCLENPQYIYFS
jgi:hypothetical protein